METLKTALFNSIIDRFDIDINGLSVINWPNDEDGEPQDFENWEILSITNDKMIMCCGGDWQEPMKVTIEMVDGKLTATNFEVGVFEDGLDSDEILNILTK